MFMSCNVAGVISDNGRLHAAAVCRAAGEPLAIEEIVVDPPKAYEIRIKIVCTTLCHTDITFWQAKVKWCAQCPVAAVQFMCEYWSIRVPFFLPSSPHP